MDNADRLRPTASDRARALVKAGLSAVPIAGGTLAELFAHLITEPLSKRRDEWIEEIAARLQALEDGSTVLSLEDLKNDPSFTTILVSATQIAIRNHQREKIDALANAVVNAARGFVPDDTERAIILSLIDRLTPTHLALLKLLHAPADNARASNATRKLVSGPFSIVIFAAFPELESREELVRLMGRDLYACGLTVSENFGTSSMPGLLQKQTTLFGDTFLGFVAAADI